MGNVDNFLVQTQKYFFNKFSNQWNKYCDVKGVDMCLFKLLDRLESNYFMPLVLPLCVIETFNH